ncbi:MAG: DUF1294 domain-containing protein [Ruminococcaceae bacterium]|nr:DUF1294 domain-containing protein [Oscillospiraceae bacterium]
MTVLLISYAVMSLVAFFLYGEDKRRAKKKKWRIRESVLLGVSLLGGAVGALIAMNFFRHKTKHWYFWAVGIVGLALQAALLVLFW